jgi:alkylation response protein AidB-like acyl-CoA dehydrogenase
MDLSFTPDQEAFRGQVREFLRVALADPFYLEHRDDPQYRSKIGRWWDETVWKAGFAGLSWPTEYGGQGRGYVEEIIFAQECYRAGAPEGISWAGKGLLGPVLLVHGTKEQKRRFLPAILAAEDIWCQGYSEPEAGSDLASLRTSAVQDGDTWILNGEKIWTSTVMEANWSFVLARTDPSAPKHRGLSFFLVPLNQPGVTVRPLVEITGEASFGSMQFDGVRVPDTQRVGDVNNGWRVANTILGFERGVTAIQEQARYRRQFDRLIDWVGKEDRFAARRDDEVFRQRAMSVLAELEILRFWCLDVITHLEAGSDIGFRASPLKLFYGELFQRLGRLALDTQGAAVAVTGGPGGVGDGYHQYEYLWAIATNIFAGTREIQLDIVAEHILGLPRGDRR